MARLPDRIRLEIVTPERQFYEGEVEKVSVPGIRGYMGILPGHSPLLSELKIGVISFTADGQEHRLFCSWGFVEVLPDRVSILAEEARTRDQIDPEKARADLKKAEDMFRAKAAEIDHEKALELYEESQAKLEVVQEG